MLFLYPMWDNESQRIGKQKCTPSGYALHSIAELLGFMGLLVGFVIILFLVYKGIIGKFKESLFWLLVVPFGIGIISEALYQMSWLLAKRKGFKYDYDKREASWDENGQRIIYKYTGKEET